MNLDMEDEFLIMFTVSTSDLTRDSSTVANNFALATAAQTDLLPATNQPRTRIYSLRCGCMSARRRCALAPPGVCMTKQTRLWTPPRREERRDAAERCGPPAHVAADGWRSAKLCRGSARVGEHHPLQQHRRPVGACDVADQRRLSRAVADGQDRCPQSRKEANQAIVIVVR